MRHIKHISIIIVILILGLRARGQQDPLYSQYMFNLFLINPAYAGSEGYTSVNLVTRKQWLDFPGSPVTFSVSAQSRILKNSFIAKALSLRKKFSKRSSSGRVGVGIHVYRDMTGPISRTGVELNYAYHIPLRQSQLSFGLGLKNYNFHVDKSMLFSGPITDPFILNNNFNRFVIDGNFGAQFTTPLLYTGLSVSNLFQSNINFGDKTSYPGLLTGRSYWLIGGYKVEINRLIMLEPSSLIKFTEHGAFQIDLTSRIYYREDYWGGLSYRTGASGGSIILLLGMRVNKYYFGYAFDYTMAPIMTHTLGSHEFMFSVKFGENARRYRWLNRY